MSAVRKRSGTSLAAVAEPYRGTTIPSMAHEALHNVDALVGRAVSILADGGSDLDYPEGRKDLREIARLGGLIRGNLLGVLAEASTGDVRALADDGDGTDGTA